MDEVCRESNMHGRHETYLKELSLKNWKRRGSVRYLDVDERVMFKWV
jgi:hypothetical protein